MNTLIFPVSPLLAVPVGRFRTVIARCGESCWGSWRWCCLAGCLVLLRSIESDVGGLNTSMGKLTALVQLRSDCVPLSLLRRVFLHPFFDKKNKA